MPELSENTENIYKQISFVSHEIRNNISISDMYTQILKRRLQNEGLYNESYSHVLNCIENALTLINANLADLKALNRSEKKICDIKKIILNSIQMSKAYIVDKDIKFDINVFENANVYADESKLLSCFLNILKNAIEAIDSVGEIGISLELKTDYAVIYFSNNGEPIPDSIRNKIFNYGYTTKDYGSGYGLCLTKQYLESQDAGLKLIKSDKNETIFEIIIPVIV